MKILGIETSCDETAVCLIEAEGDFGPPPVGGFKFRVLGNALHSQIATHAPWGGVFPNLAKREHAKNLMPLLEVTLQQAGELRPADDSMIDHDALETLLEREPELFAALKTFLQTHGKPDIDAIAVTYGPGLEPALWVGVNFAKALSLVWDIPIVPVNHLEGHIAMAAMNLSDDISYASVSRPTERQSFGRVQKTSIAGQLHVFEFPALALLISGGHTELDVMQEWGAFQTVGETRDDAVGEAFDKVARMVGIPYPGGAELSRFASLARRNPGGEASRISLPRPMIHEDNCDFSFSGLKTAVRRLVAERDLSDEEKMSLAREFEDAAADVLVKKTMRAVEEYGAQTVLVGGGVSANEYIKQRLAASLDVPVLAPPPELATDNALMIALAGYFRALHKEFADAETLRANGNLKLGSG